MPRWGGGKGEGGGSVLGVGRLAAVGGVGRTCFLQCIVEKGWCRVCQKITMVSVLCGAWAAVHTCGLLGVEHPEQERVRGRRKRARFP